MLKYSITHEKFVFCKILTVLFLVIFIGSPRELISRLAVQRSVEVTEQWSNFIQKAEYTNLTYSYRMVCDDNYYGPSCSVMCEPRTDQFGHYTCTSNGTIVCLDGWTGNYCDQGKQSENG